MGENGEDEINEEQGEDEQSELREGRRKLQNADAHQEEYIDDSIEDAYENDFDLDDDESEDQNKKDKKLNESDRKLKGNDESSAFENPEKNHRKGALLNGSDSKL